MAAVTKMDKEYQADCDLRTLIEAAKIKKDKSRLGPAMRKHREMMVAMKDAGLQNGAMSKDEKK
jgi:hypothetical protein